MIIHPSHSIPCSPIISTRHAVSTRPLVGLWKRLAKSLCTNDAANIVAAAVNRCVQKHHSKLHKHLELLLVDWIPACLARPSDHPRRTTSTSSSKKHRMADSLSMCSSNAIHNCLEKHMLGLLFYMFRFTSCSVWISGVATRSISPPHKLLGCHASQSGCTENSTHPPRSPTSTQALHHAMGLHHPQFTTQEGSHSLEGSSFRGPYNI